MQVNYVGKAVDLYKAAGYKLHGSVYAINKHLGMTHVWDKARFCWSCSPQHSLRSLYSTAVPVAASACWAAGTLQHLQQVSFTGSIIATAR